MGALRHLRIVSLRGNAIAEGAIPKGEYLHLHTLNLADNHLPYVPPGLEQCPALQYLHLYRNRIDGPLPDVVGSLTQLVGLNVSRNALTSVQCVARLTQLTFLAASYNKLSGQFPAAIVQLPHLTHLELHHNDLTAIELGEASQDLELVDVSNNRLVSVPVVHPRAITKLVVRDNPCTAEE